MGERKELKVLLHRNIIITLEIMPPSIMVSEGFTLHGGGAWSCWECCCGSQKCHHGCHRQSFIVQCLFSGRKIPALHTKYQSNAQKPPISLSRNWKYPEEKEIPPNLEFRGEQTWRKKLPTMWRPLLGKGCFICLIFFPQPPHWSQSSNCRLLIENINQKTSAMWPVFLSKYD